MVSFQAEGVSIPKMNFATISKWINAVASGYNRRVGDVVYKFCSDDAILKANQDFLNHNFYTDIITFDYSIGNKVGGDILISIDTVKSNAEKFEVPYVQELRRVIIHGILHLCGLKDKTPKERDEMEKAENKALDLYDTFEG